MDRPSSAPLIAAGALLGAAAYLYLRPSSRAGIAAALSAPGEAKSPNPSTLSRRRQAVLAYLSDVIPCKYPDDKFMAIVGPGYKPDDPSKPPGYTTCGSLPCYIGRKLGVTAPLRAGVQNNGYCITQGGLASLITNAKAAEAWIVPDGSNRPLPGDFVAWGAESAPGHVGVFVERKDIQSELTRANDAVSAAKGKWPKYAAERHLQEVKDWIAKGFKEVWVTADTGLGTPMQQEGGYLIRPYDPITNTTLGISGRRSVTGWYNIDKAPGVAL